jgi:methylmalonyl-CoA mutase cobalamin-binding subunit
MYIDANRLTKNCGDFSADGEYSASITSIVENLRNQDSGRIIILHGGANDVDEFPMVFSRILHTG